MNPLQTELVNVADSILIVIDVQPLFVNKLEPQQQTALVERISWLVDVAVALDVPLVVTAEDLANCGGLMPELAGRLPKETAVYDKQIFGLADQADILAAVRETGRETAVLIGLETDVCVAHSALGLLQAGYKVATVVDAVGSPGLGQEIGLARMRGAGVVMLSCKSLYYEWVRTVARDNTIKKEHLLNFEL
ncbi:MAG: isochorismatase family protein [Chloroflexota bacterium]